MAQNDGLIVLHDVLSEWMNTSPHDAAIKMLRLMARKPYLDQPAGDSGLAARIMRTRLRDYIVFEDDENQTILTLLRDEAKLEAAQNDRLKITRPGPAQQVLLACAAAFTRMAAALSVPDFADNLPEETT